jgi:predicted 2-oxoglutarate/Fe(II)-dependent dioxygenase YbiX
MKKNLSHYIKHYPGFLDKKLCIETIKQLEKLNKSSWKEHVFYNPMSKEYSKLSGTKELSITFNNGITTEKEIMEKIWQGLLGYMNYLNFKWYDSWQGYTQIRFNKYVKNKKMAEHCDHIHTIFEGERKGIPILSVLGVLNDDYTGGEFIILEDQEIKFKAGDLLIFPSIFLYPHKVEPVKKGTRYSFISWVW